jgi:putative transposase
MYDSDLKEDEWLIVKKLILVKRRGPKVPEARVRNKLNALLYLLKTGCQWRMLPKEYGPWRTVYEQLRRWRDCGILEKLLAILNKLARGLKGKKATPSLMIMDTQSVKTVQKGGRAVMTATRKLRAESAVCS